MVIDPGFGNSQADNRWRFGYGGHIGCSLEKDIVMALISLILLTALSALYFNRSRTRKPEDPLFNLEDKSGYLAKVNDFMRKTIQCDAMTVFFIYSVVATLLTLVIPIYGSGLLLRFLANVIAALMLLPFVVEGAAVKYKGKVNAAVLQELANLAGWVLSPEKYFAIGGGVVAFLLFFVLFR